MASQTFGTSNTTLKQLLGNGLTYRVPQYQRDYSWKQDEWDDLWEDIKTALTDIDDPAHYMGYIVLQTTDNKQFDVIDGQQRLATLSVLALATISVLLDLADEGVDTEDNRRRAEQFRATFIGYLDPVTLVPMSKLRLNRNDEGFYQDYLVPLKRLQQRRLRPSERLLQAAFEWFRRKIFESCGEKRRGEDIARFLDTLSDRLFFTTIIVNDELNAFTVFETLNARGVELSPADLLKNHLFAVVSRQRSTSDADLETLDRRWKDLADRIGSGAVKDFIRAHWISRKRPIRAAALFKEMRRDVGDRRKVFELVSQLEDDLGIYLGLSGDGGETWQPNTRDDAEILRMFNVKLPWPLLMATFRRFEENGFAQVLHACVVIAL